MSQNKISLKSIIKNSLIILIETTILAIIITIIIRSIDRNLIDLLVYPIELSIPNEIQFLGFVIIIIGFIFVIWANYTLLYVKRISLRDREPFHVPSSLALTGPYKFSRNPIYLGVLLLILGTCLLMESITVFIVAILCYIIFRFFIKWEEEHLENKFGQQYIEFKKKVRRWI